MGMTNAPERIRSVLAADQRTYAWLSRTTGIEYKVVLAEVKHETRPMSLDNAIRYAKVLRLTVPKLVA